MELGIERKIEIEVNGEKLFHYFRELPSAEWLEWQRKIAQVDGEGDIKNAELVLLAYDRHGVRVEGYTINGADLMEAHSEEWREIIPGNHKVLAWLEFVGGNELKKKSEMRSES